MLSWTFKSGVRIWQFSRCMQNSPSFSCEQSVIPEGPFDAFENLRDRYLVRAFRASRYPPFGPLWLSISAALGEGLKHFGQQFEGDVIFLCNFFRIHHAPRCHVAELDSSDVLKGHEGIICFFRNLQHLPIADRLVGDYNDLRSILVGLMVAREISDLSTRNRLKAEKGIRYGRNQSLY